jgi:hypothetical protein
MCPGITGKPSAMHSTSSFSSSTRPQPLQPAEHTARLAQGVTGPLAAEVGATSCDGKQPSRLPALQRKPRACRLLRSPVPPWFLGTIGCTSSARWCGVCQATACPAALAAAPGASVNPVLDRAADRLAVAAQLQQLVAFAVAQLVAADQGVGALLVAGDAVEGEPCPPSAHQDPAGHVLRRGRAAAAQELREHQGLDHVAHAHAPRDGVAQALVGAGGGWGHGGILGVAWAA